ncbi:MAG: lysophospholipid acyltransferase family protein [Armatimonadia bacterium]
MSSKRKKNPVRRALEQAVVRCILGALVISIRHRSLTSVRKLATRFAGVLSALVPKRQRMMERNLQAVFGPSLTPERNREIRRQSIVNICKTMGEMFKMQWMTPEELREQVTVVGTEHIDAGLARGKGVVIITAHFGNWEFGGAALALHGYPMNVIARDATSNLAAELTNESRRSKGEKVFGRWDTRQLLRALRENECVAILPDQHAVDAAVRVTFLGLPADSASGPALFALRTGATFVMAFAQRQPDDHFLVTVTPGPEYEDTGDRGSDVRRFTQKLNDLIGEKILHTPEQWLWLHNRWKAPRDTEPANS